MSSPNNTNNHNNLVGRGRQSVCVWLLLALVLVDVALRVAFAAPAQSNPYTAKLSSYFHAGVKPEVVILGSSIAMSASQRADSTFDASLRSGGPSQFSYAGSRYLEQLLSARLGLPLRITNLAVAGGMPSDAFMILKKAVEFQRTPRVVIYETAIRDFIDNSMPEPTRTPYWESLSQMHSWQSGMIARDLVDSACGSLVLFSNAVISGLRGGAWRAAGPDAAGAGERAGERLLTSTWFYYKDRAGVASQLTGLACRLCGRQPSLAASILKAGGEPARYLRCELARGYSRYDWKPNDRLLDAQMSYLSRITDLCRQAGLTLVVVNMPLTAGYEARIPGWLLRKYHAQLSARMEQAGFTVINLHDPRVFTDRDFVDAVHANASGGCRIQRRLCDKLVAASVL